MGAQDSLDRAADFIAETGTNTPLMIWDAGFETWAYYGVNGQPIAILVDRDGNPIAGWRGLFDEEEVLQLAAEA